MRFTLVQFENYLLNYSLNCTPLSPITITNNNNNNNLNDKSTITKNKDIILLMIIIIIVIAMQWTQWKTVVDAYPLNFCSYMTWKG